MKYKKRATFILSTIAVFGIVLFISIFLLNNNKVISSSKQIEASSYPGVDIVTEIMDEKNYSMAIHYPEFKVEQSYLNDQVINYIFESKEDFLKEIEHSNKFLKGKIATLYILFDIYPANEGIYSIVFNKEEKLPEARSNDSSKIFIIDTNENRLINQGDIIINSEQSRDKLYKLLVKKVEESEKYQDYLFNTDLKKWIKDEKNDLSNMFVKEDAIVFKFDNNIEISITYREARDIIEDKWLERLYPDIKEESKEEKDFGDIVYEKVVALTFDDGPHGTYTLKILDLLDEYGAKATFFVLGNRVDFYPGITKEIEERGHEIGNHSWNHKNFTTLSKKQLKSQIKKTNEVIEKVTGKKPTLYRPPYGAINNKVKDYIDMSPVLWTVDTKDWKSRNPKKILKAVKQNVKDGSIILMHDIHAPTVEGLELVLKYLDKEGYKCVTVSELESIKKDK